MYKQLQASKSFFLSYLFFLLIGGILLIAFSKIDLFLYVNTRHHIVTDYFFRYYTHIGDGTFYVLVIIALLFFKYRYALAALVSFLVSSGLSQILKHLVFDHALRPKAYFEKLGQPLRLIEGLEVHTYNSFPSGHSISSFSVFCILALVVADKRWALIFFLLALIGGFSRIYLAQHFLEDVYAGSVIGVLSSLLGYYLICIRSQSPWLEKSLVKR